MRARTSGSSALVALGAALLVGGCVLFTGSTDGYTQQPTPEDADIPACGVDAAACIVNQCVSSADCGDAGQQCCFGELSPSVLAWSCQSGGCSGLNFQVCATSAECGDAGACTTQTCGAQGIAVEVRACGLISSCTANDGG